jgi:glucose-6-phosphate dehydrogenase assembly protein OpcA
MINLPLTQHFREVALSEIETALDRLWREANETALAGGSHAIARNTALTLMAYTTHAEEANVALGAVADLAVQHPARAIVLLAEPEQQHALVDARIAVRAHGSGPGAIYGEEILIEARGGAARQVPGVVLPLMVPGLPAFLWWLGEPPWKSALIETLVDGCDRLIIDSCEATDGDRMLAAAADLMMRKRERCALSDFNWTRQIPWRELTAQFFDAPILRPYLDGIDHVSVEYAAGDEDAPTNNAQAYLYVGWLASRLGWTLPVAHRRGYDPARQHTLHDANGRPVLVEVAARFGLNTRSWCAIDQAAHRAPDVAASDVSADGTARRDAPPPGGPGDSRRAIGHGALMSVRIHALHDRRPGTFIIARDQDLAHATTLCQVDSGAPPSHTVHLASLGETALLHGQLEVLGHDAIYEAALAAAAHLVGFDRGRSML